MTDQNTAASTSAFGDLLYVAAPFLILVTPFVSFVDFAAYGYRTELFISVGLFLLPALLFGTLLINGSNRVRAITLLILLTVAADFLLPFDAALSALGNWIDHAINNRLTLPDDIRPFVPIGALVAGYAVVLVLVLILRRLAIMLCALGFGALAIHFLIVGSWEPDRSFTERSGTGINANTDLAPVVHIILGGHNAVAALDDESERSLRATIESRYPERGFRLFRHAYSQYHDARNSIPALMNFDTPDRDAAWLDQPAWGGRPLSAAAYMIHLAGQGYRVSVYQTDQLDICAGARAAIARCLTWHGATPQILATLPLPMIEKLVLIWGLYLERSDIHEAIRAAYRRHAAPLAVRFGIPAPAWSWHGGRLDSLTAPAIQARLESDLRAGGGGTAYVVSFPTGSPYAYGEDCTLYSETTRWLEPTDRTRIYPMRNSAAGAVLRRKRLAAQLGCVHQRLGAILDTIDEAPAMAEAMVLIHGIHGSHIALHEPTAVHETAADENDFLNGFSTFFAVRSPHLTPGTTDQPTPLHASFPTFFGISPSAGGESQVYLFSTPRGPLAARRAEEALPSLYGASDTEPDLADPPSVS